VLVVTLPVVLTAVMVPVRVLAPVPAAAAWKLITAWQARSRNKKIRTGGSSGGGRIILRLLGRARSGATSVQISF
jgi:hypothetical protein